MNLRRVRLFAVGFLIALSSVALAEPKGEPDWNAWRFLEGKWVGEGSSEQGQGSGYFTFEPALQGRAWIRRNLSEYPGKDGKYVHEDLMIVYFDQPSNEIKAFYHDTEGHVIHYRAAFSADKNNLTFVSDRQEGVPRFRLTYIRIGPEEMSVKLEMSKPDKPDDFQKKVEGKVHKVAK